MVNDFHNWKIQKWDQAPKKDPNWLWESIKGTPRLISYGCGNEHQSSKYSTVYESYSDITQLTSKDRKQKMCCMIWEKLDTHAHKSAANTFVSRFGFDSIPNNAIKETFKAQDESIPLSPAQNKQSSKCIAATVASSLTELFTCGGTTTINPICINAQLNLQTNA